MQDFKHNLIGKMNPKKWNKNYKHCPIAFEMSMKTTISNSSLKKYSPRRNKRMRIYMTESNLVKLSSYAGTLQGGARETSRIWRRRRVAEIGF